MAHKLAVSRNDIKKMRKTSEAKIADLYSQLAEMAKKENSIKNDLSH